MTEEEQEPRAPDTKPSQRIIVGFDILTDATDAVMEALAFATLLPKTHVEVVWVPPMAYVPGGPGVDAKPLETLNRRVKELLREFGVDKLTESDIRVSAIVGEGRPSQALSRIAFMHEADMIIIGSHDKKSSIEKFLLGSVAKRLVGEAPCPVLVMRPRAIEAVPEVDEPLADGQARRRIALGHRYHSVSRNVRARENMPLLFPMEGA